MTDSTRKRPWVRCTETTLAYRASRNKSRSPGPISAQVVVECSTPRLAIRGVLRCPSSSSCCETPPTGPPGYQPQPHQNSRCTTHCPSDGRWPSNRWHAHGSVKLRANEYRDCQRAGFAGCAVRRSYRLPRIGKICKTPRETAKTLSLAVSFLFRPSCVVSTGG